MLFSKEVFRESGDLSKKVLLIFGVIFSSGINLSIIQSFVSKISLEHLTASSYLSHMLSPFLVLGSVCGSSIIMLNKEANSQKRDLLNGALFFTGATGLVLCLGLFALLVPLGSYTEVLSVSGYKLHGFLFVLSGIFFGLNIVLRMSLIADQKIKSILALEIFGNGGMLFGNWLALRIITHPTNQFISIAAVTLMVQVAVFFSRFSQIRKHFRLRLQLAKSYFRRTSIYLRDESVIWTLTYLSSFVISLLFGHSNDSESVAAYNVGLNLEKILLAPIGAISIGGISRLAGQWQTRGTKSWDTAVNAIRLLALMMTIVPAIVITALIPIVVAHFFHLSSYSAQLIVGSVVLAAVPWAMTIHIICQIRTFERSKFLGATELVTQYAIGIPVVFYFVSNEKIVEAALAGILLPSIIQSAAIYTYEETLGRMRRMTPRYVFPIHQKAVAYLNFVDKTLAEKKYRLFDLSIKGCGIFTAPSNIRRFTRGDVVEGQVRIQDEVAFSFKGTVRYIGIERKSYFSKEKHVRVGIEFIKATHGVEDCFADMIKSRAA